MNILIVGEFSGFSKNLKVGLNELGHKVSIMSTGDNFKKIKIDEGDINILKYYTKRLNNKYLNFIFRIIIVYLNRVRLKLFLKKNYDIIFLLNAGFIVPGIFSIKAGLPLKWLKKFIIKGTPLFLSACGLSPALVKHAKELKYGFAYNKYESLYNDKDIRQFESICELCKKIIPMDYENEYSLKKYNSYSYINKVVRPILLPYDVSNTRYTYYETDKIIITHGINRYDAKGSKYILEAMHKIKNKYPESVDLFIPEHLPYEDYLACLDKTNIFIDQCLGYGMGVNASIGLAMGKIVLGGCEEENNKSIGIDAVPVINIEPNVDQIYNELEKLILLPSEARFKISLSSREFAEKYIDSKIIAKKYEQIFIDNK